MRKELVKNKGKYGRDKCKWYEEKKLNYINNIVCLFGELNVELRGMVKYYGYNGKIWSKNNRIVSLVFKNKILLSLLILLWYRI